MRQLRRVQRALYDAGWMPLRLAGITPAASAVRRSCGPIVGEEVVGRRLAEPGPYSMLEVLAPTMIDYARPELAAEMVPRLLSAGRSSGARASPSPARGAISRR